MIIILLIFFLNELTNNERYFEINLDFEFNNKKVYKCSLCNEKITKYSKSHLCKKCSQVNHRKVERPSYEQLLEEICILGYSATGRKYNVSDNTIRKWVKLYENIKKINTFV